MTTDQRGRHLHRQPSKYEQAKERARDELTRTELTNMVLDLPSVHEIIVDGEDEDWRPTTITVGFDDSNNNHAGDVATIMRRQGWKFDGVTFAHLNRVRFVERECDV